MSGALQSVHSGDDMLEPPRSDLDAVLVGDLQERAEASLQLARGSGHGSFGLQLAPRRPHFLVPHLTDRLPCADLLHRLFSGGQHRLDARSLRIWHLGPGQTRHLGPGQSGRRSGVRGGIRRCLNDDHRFYDGLRAADDCRDPEPGDDFRDPEFAPARARIPWRLAGSVVAVDDGIEEVAELLKHVTQGRLGPGDPVDLLGGEREESVAISSKSGNCSSAAEVAPRPPGGRVRQTELPGAAP